MRDCYPRAELGHCLICCPFSGSCCGPSLSLLLVLRTAFPIFLAWVEHGFHMFPSLTLKSSQRDTKLKPKRFRFKPHSSIQGCPTKGSTFFCPGCPRLWHLSTSLGTKPPLHPKHPTEELSADPCFQPRFLAISWTLAYLAPSSPNFSKCDCLPFHTLLNYLLCGFCGSPTKTRSQSVLPSYCQLACFLS